MKVYYHPTNNSIGINSQQDLVLFHYEKDRFTFVYDVDQADIIPLPFYGPEIKYVEYLKELGATNQLILILDTNHIGDYGNTFDMNLYIDILKSSGYRSLVVHCDHSVMTDRLIHYDYMWNRQKIYFTDYDNYDLTNRLWTFKSTKKMFELNEINPKKIVKKFLVPNKTYKQELLLVSSQHDESQTLRSKFRVILEKAILEEDCYFSNPNNYIFLEPQECSKEILDDYHFLNMGMGFHPVANHYYENSAVSVFVESLASSESKQREISEKTFNPLIKGHFILPFSYSGIVDDLKDMYGFRFPKWIDYSYDKIEDDRERFHEFMKSFARLRFIKLKDLEELCNKDIGILLHNRQVFYDRPYDRLYDSLQKIINIV
jgi:hypothetical protein